MSLLAIDVGNTNIVLGIFSGETLQVSWRLTTLPGRTVDELWLLVSRLFSEKSIPRDDIEGVVLASVVPELTPTVSKMVKIGFKKSVLVVDAGNTGLTVRYENPVEVGADRLVNSVAALKLFGQSPRPIIVVDFGTATTFDVISSSGEYDGGVICPGVDISAEALFNRAARLPMVSVRKPDTVIGRTTISSMQSGLFYGYVSMVEGILDRLKNELQNDQKVWCVATGGLASAVASETTRIDKVCDELTLIGLRCVWEYNRWIQANTVVRSSHFFVVKTTGILFGWLAQLLKWCVAGRELVSH